MIKYKANYGVPSINKVYVLAETKAFVEVPCFTIGNDQKTEKVRKAGVYFDTWDEAHAAVIAKASERADIAKQDFDDAFEVLSNAISLGNPAE